MRWSGKSVSRFFVWMGIDPASVPRVLEPFVLKGLNFQSVTVREEAGEHYYVILDIANLPEQDAVVLVRKLKQIFLVKRVNLETILLNAKC